VSQVKRQFTESPKLPGEPVGRERVIARLLPVGHSSYACLVVTPVPGSSHPVTTWWAINRVVDNSNLSHKRGILK